jgi:hypothetical protein
MGKLEILTKILEIQTKKVFVWIVDPKSEKSRKPKQKTWKSKQENKFEFLQQNPEIQTKKKIIFFVWISVIFVWIPGFFVWIS